MTATEMVPAIGQEVVVRFESLYITCTVKDVKTSWNKVRLLIVPLAGCGEQWVEMGRVSLATTRANKLLQGQVS